MSFKRYKKKYNSESDLIKSVFAPLINLNIRTAMQCCHPDSFPTIIEMFRNFEKYYKKDISDFPSPLKVIHFEIQKQAENFVASSIERGVLCL